MSSTTAVAACVPMFRRLDRVARESTLSQFVPQIQTQVVTQRSYIYHPTHSPLKNNRSSERDT